MNRTIYVLCPGGLKTGGTELLHQLVFQINKNTSNRAFIVYYSNLDDPMVRPFKHYIKGEWITEEKINDIKENIIIIPETALSEFDNFKQAKKYIWWLSVDNFLVNNSYMYSIKQFGIVTATHYLLNGTIRNRTKKIFDADLNLCQSYYAINYLRSIGVKDDKIKYLSDYINEIYLTGNIKLAENNRENIILYNPKKGYEFTKKIIKNSPKSFKWVALEGFTNLQVKELLSTSKVYIDFGNHPGKDRFPREAALSGCCIITGKRGAAGFKRDIPISEKYKFSDNEKNIPLIIEAISFVLNNYNVAVGDFKDYRNNILKEKQQFIDGCKQLFND